MREEQVQEFKDSLPYKVEDLKDEDAIWWYEKYMEDLEYVDRAEAPIHFTDISCCDLESGAFLYDRESGWFFPHVGVGYHQIFINTLCTLRGLHDWDKMQKIIDGTDYFGFHTDWYVDNCKGFFNSNVGSNRVTISKDFKFTPQERIKFRSIMTRLDSI